MITRNDEAIFRTWCEDQLSLYDAVVCLDGSTNEITRRVAAAYADKLVYLHESNFEIPHKTDRGLRRIVHEEIVRRFGVGHWIMCCHADEFCYHDPRKVAALADGCGSDLISWYSPHFYPHPSELADWDDRKELPVPERHRHYHWGHGATQLPWIGDRLYLCHPGVCWDERTHGSVRPYGLERAAPFHPIYRHFKVIANGDSRCDVTGDCTYYQRDWKGLESEVGVPFRVEQFEDLFVSSVRNYSRCDRFEGVFHQPWNLGDEFRPAKDLCQFVTSAAPPHIESKTEDKFESVSQDAHSRAAPRLCLALGPENPNFGSWNWLGVDLLKHLVTDFDATSFRESIPEADILIFFKFLPDANTLRTLRIQSAIVFCPVDVYGSAAEIDSDVSRLRLCDRIVVHCRRLIPYFQSYSPTTYLDHHLKYVIPTRRTIVTDGPVLWVGEQSNLPPVIEWVNNHDLPAELVILSNANSNEIATIRCRVPIRYEPWSPENHLKWLDRCRCAFDIKGDDFRARHKPPAKALDFLASGIPLAMNYPSSSVDHVRDLGLDVPSPDEPDRWLSADYAIECQRFGRVMTEALSLQRQGAHWRSVLQDVANARSATAK